MPTKQPDMKIRKSKNPIRGVIINATGEPDSGKTSFALSSGAEPERTAFIDDDIKGAAIVSQLKAQGRSFGLYRNLIKEGKGMREIEFHKLCMGILDELADHSGDFDVLVWDTWTRFENTFHPAVVSNPNRHRQFYSAQGQIKGAEQWGAAFEYESATLSALTDVAPLVILTSHLKKDASKRDVAESKKPLIQKSWMRVYLRHTPNTPEPTGLMLKRPMKMEVSAGMKPINVTHRKVVPFTWETLLHYWENPVGNTPPGPDEQLNEFEMSILDGILTRDQKDILALALIDAEREREQEKKQARLQKRIMGQNGNENPTTAAALMMKAMSEYSMDLKKVAEILEINEDDVMDMGPEQVEEAWEKIKASK